MAKNDNLKDFLIDVANAIREKKGTIDKINPQDFSDEIKNISSSGLEVKYYKPDESFFENPDFINEVKETFSTVFVDANPPALMPAQGYDASIGYVMFTMIPKLKLNLFGIWGDMDTLFQASCDAAQIENPLSRFEITEEEFFRIVNESLNK